MNSLSVHTSVQQLQYCSLHCSNCQMRPIATDGVVWSVCVSICWWRSWALQKWLNQSRCRLEGRLGWAQGTV